MGPGKVLPLFWLLELVPEFPEFVPEVRLETQAPDGAVEAPMAEPPVPEVPEDALLPVLAPHPPDALLVAPEEAV
jgi:hypothetical protein